MRAVEEHTSFSIENHIRARSDRAIQTEQPGDYGSRFAEHWSAKCSTFLARSITATGPFVLDVTLSKMHKRSTNHGRSDEGEMPCASHDVTCSPAASAP
jgi:hypothetical protein